MIPTLKVALLMYGRAQRSTAQHGTAPHGRAGHGTARHRTALRYAAELAELI